MLIRQCSWLADGRAAADHIKVVNEYRRSTDTDAILPEINPYICGLDETYTIEQRSNYELYALIPNINHPRTASAVRNFKKPRVITKRTLLVKYSYNESAAALVWPL